MKFIQYNLSGIIIDQYSCDFTQLTTNPIGQKVRVTMDDGRIYIVFLDTFIGQNAIQTVEVNQYDLNEETSELRSNESIVTFIPTIKIIKLEAIQYSNPRWRGQNRLTSLSLLNL